jgi:NAD(P)H-hydrate epimerase
MSALAAEASGVDLVFLCIPDWHENVAKSASLNFQVFPLTGNSLEEQHVRPMLELLATMDCAIIGPGIGHDQENIDAVNALVAEAQCDLVLDATALQPETVENIAGKTAVLTPHLGELERMGLTPDEMSNVPAVVLLKGETDVVTSPDGRHEEVSDGNAGLTTGGTGDVLAGITGGLIAQGVEPFDAAVTASKIMKAAGDELFETHGYAYTARDVIGRIPLILHNL